MLQNLHTYLGYALHICNRERFIEREGMLKEGCKIKLIFKILG